MSVSDTKLFSYLDFNSPCTSDIKIPFASDTKLPSAVPRFCKHDFRVCTVNPKYSLSNITGPDSISFGQDKARHELGRHGHPKCFKMPDGKQRNAKQTINELIFHYKYYHSEKNGKKLTKFFKKMYLP